jgi:ABC-2 type transport system ATP-binding protein
MAAQRRIAADPSGELDSLRPELEVRNVSRWYGNVVAVNDVSFRIGPGITGLLGPNGAGKSTLLHMLAGLLKPSNGEVSVIGLPVWRRPEVYHWMGLVQEKEAVYPFMTGFEFVRLSARLHGLEDPEAASLQALADVELLDVKDRATGGYSKGMKQRVKIAAAIVHRPPIVLLDEPFNGADPRQRLRMMDLLREMAAAGTVIVFSSHILEEVERLAENVLVIVAGRLAAAGEFHEIRRLMTDRPYTLTLRTSDNRRFASALIDDESVYGVEIAGEALTVRSFDFLRFARLAPRLARRLGISVYQLEPTDESLESVFSYLVQR